MLLRGDVFSRTLGMNTGITVVGPQELVPGEPYQICYLLHGLCGNCGDWAAYTLLPYLARDYRVLFVMPEATRSFYTDMARGQKFHSYVADELPDICRSVFSVSAERGGTAIVGASMGGYGALKCALTRPDRYARVAAFSPACLYLKEDLAALRSPVGRARAEEHFGPQLPLDFQAIFGDALEWRKEHDVVELAKAVAAGPVKPELFLACGEGDYLIESCRRFQRDLEAMNYPFVYEEGPGEHDWLYFNGVLEKTLRRMYGR